MGPRLLTPIVVLTFALSFALVAPQIAAADDTAPPSTTEGKKKEEAKGDQAAPKPPVPQPPKPAPVAKTEAPRPPEPAKAAPAPVAVQPPAPAKAVDPKPQPPATAQPAKAPDDKGPKPAATPPPAAKVKIVKFRFAGNSAISTGELEAVVAGHVGKEYGLDQLRTVADAVTDLYRARGFTVAKALIPAQEVKDGVVEIQVLEGMLGQVIVQGNENYHTDFIAKRLKAAAPDGAINQAELERSLLLLNELQDLKVTAMLVRGQAPGTVDIVATVDDRSFPLALTLDYNNFGSEGTGRSRIGMQVDWSNAIVPGAAMSLRGVIGDEGDNFGYFRGSYVAPINDLGTKLGLWGNWGTFDVDRFFRELDIEGESWGLGFYANHPYIKERELSLAFDLGLDLKDTELQMLGDVTSDDRIRTLHLGANFDNVCLDGRNYASLYVNQGLGSFLGGMDDDDRSSRRGADGVFTKFNLTFTRVQHICDWLTIMLRTAGQISTDELVAGEQMQIGGADTVRGYRQGEHSGDDGYLVSLEPRVTFTHDENMWYVPQFAAFIDHAGVHRKVALIGEGDWDQLTGAGVGLRWHAPQNIDVRFDVGFPVSGDEAGDDDDDVQFYVSGSVKF